jgi:hypothetical protein
MNNMDIMREILSDLAQNKVSNIGAEQRLIEALPVDFLAGFIVDAFQRDWITNFNMGLKENGDVC